MTLQSMTGFARIEGQNETANWVWEVRSVNGKGLDFRTRTPPQFDGLQPAIRKIGAKYFSRGNMQISLQLVRHGASAVPVINQPVLDAVIDAISEIHQRLDCSPPAAEQILSIKGVLEQREIEESEAEKTALEKSLLADFEMLAIELRDNRASEGAAITKILLNQIDTIGELTKAIVKDPSRSPDQIKKRLNEQVSRLLDNTSGLDLDRLHQEAAILAAKVDLQEELDRLNAHIISARELLVAKGPVGRKLDFLCQEFNRECNTICSKSNAPAVTANGLEMKVVIDQLREQVQNLE